MHPSLSTACAALFLVRSNHLLRQRVANVPAFLIIRSLFPTSSRFAPPTEEDDVFHHPTRLMVDCVFFYQRRLPFACRTYAIEAISFFSLPVVFSKCPSPPFAGFLPYLRSSTRELFFAPPSPTPLRLHSNTLVSFWTNTFWTSLLLLTQQEALNAATLAAVLLSSSHARAWMTTIFMCDSLEVTAPKIERLPRDFFFPKITARPPCMSVPAASLLRAYWKTVVMTSEDSTLRFHLRPACQMRGRSDYWLLTGQQDQQLSCTSPPLLRVSRLLKAIL